MRKFLLPIINLVNVILVSITFGIAANPAVTNNVNAGVNEFPYYQLVWNPAKDHANVIGIVGFFLFTVACLIMLFNFLPVKARKITTMVTGAMFISAGVLFLKTPYGADLITEQYALSGSLIAMAVLVIVAGALTLLMTVIEIIPQKKEN